MPGVWGADAEEEVAAPLGRKCSVPDQSHTHRDNPVRSGGSRSRSSRIAAVGNTNRSIFIRMRVLGSDLGGVSDWAQQLSEPRSCHP